MSDEENNNSTNDTPADSGSGADSPAEVPSGFADSGKDPTADAPPMPQGKPARMYSEGKRFPKSETNTEGQQGNDTKDVSD